MATESKQFLRPEDLAKQLGITRWRVYQMVERGQLVGIKIGRSIFIPTDSLAKLIAQAEADAAARRARDTMKART